MKTILAALASAAFMTAPLALSPSPAAAAPHGGFHGGFHGYYGGWRGGWGWGVPVGVALGAALWDPWYYEYPGYAYGYYPDPYYYGYAYGPPPPPQGGASPPAAAQAAPQTGQACGSWSWNAPQSKYDWVPCAAPAAH
jgi:hypothetical protein